MTDWREAGRKADAHRIRNLWREPFDNQSKGVVRNRVRDALLAAGGSVCLDLGAGGNSALVLKTAGFQVISVEDGSFRLEDRGGPVSALRKRRAHERTAAEGGYEARWGKAADFAHEADVAFLDFCGPWSSEVRKTIAACGHMKAIAVTLMTDHDISSGATNQRERLLAYLDWLRDAYRPKPSNRQVGAGKLVRATPCRLIAQYRRPGGQPVWVFLLSPKRIAIRHLSPKERYRLSSESSKKQYAKEKERRAADPEYRARRNAYQRERHRLTRSDPAYRERMNARQRERWAEKKAAKVRPVPPDTHGEGLVAKD